MLYIVGTPIGNLQDITFRATEVLKNCDVILCEDTRITKVLASHVGSNAKLVRYNELDDKSIKNCLNLLKSGKSCALVSDNGTPCISDPGYKLVAEARKEGIKIESIPGASALTSALTLSGLSAGSFIFLGFLPRKPSKVKDLLINAKNFHKTIVIYESPYRVLKLLENVMEIFGDDTKISLSREITKAYEETINGEVSEVYDDFSKRDKIRGEFVLVIEASEKPKRVKKNKYDKNI